MAGMLACLSLSGISPASESAIPRGTLSVDRDWVRVGAKSRLSWQIEYPAPVTGVVDIVPPNTVKPKKDVTMKLRVLGASFQQAKSNNGHGNNADGVDSSNPGKGSGGPNGAPDLSRGYDDETKNAKSTYLPVEFLWCVNGSAWSRVFYGYQTEVDPTAVLLETPVKSGDTLNFGGRGWRNGSWLPFYHTAKATKNLVMLKNGDRVPTTVPAFNGVSIESYLKPYLDVVTKTVKIGDRDLILLMELGQTRTTASGFDLQDLVVLVTFE